MNLSQFESPTPLYSGRGETALALAVLPLAFFHTLLECLSGSRAIPGQPWPYMLLLSGFSAVALGAVLFLATPAGDRLVRRLLAAKRLFCLSVLPVVYVGCYLLLLRLLNLPQLYTHALAMQRRPWSSLSLPVFLALAAVLLTAGCYAGLRLASRDAAATPPADRFFGWRQLCWVLPAVIPYLILQRHLPLLWCFTTPVAVLVMIYATGLGREYFGFSLVPRSLREFLTVLVLLAVGLSAFLLITMLSGSIAYTGTLWNSDWITWYKAAFMWLVIVGISEEVIFRCGILTLIAAYMDRRTKKTDSPALWGHYPRLGAVLLTSVLFGVAHLYRGVTFAMLAFIASLLYSLSFVIGKSLSGPVLLHGILNVLILRNFQL